jgi:plastocyanin
MPITGFRRRTPAFTVLALLAIALRPAASPAAIVELDVFNNDFGITHVDPTITIGDTIRWNFRQLNHNVITISGQPQSFESPGASTGTTIPVGGMFDFTFTIPGTYTYICNIHGFEIGGGQTSGMAGRIFVVPEPTLILTVSAIGMAVGGCCVRRWRGRRDGAQGPAA